MPTGWVPFRGDGNSRDIKPKRRFVNRKQQRNETIKSILIVALFSTILFGFLSYVELINGKGAQAIASFVLRSIITLILSFGIARLNRFRKGYDVDISDEEDREKEADT